MFEMRMRDVTTTYPSIMYRHSLLKVSYNNVYRTVLNLRFSATIFRCSVAVDGRQENPSLSPAVTYKQ